MPLAEIEALDIEHKPMSAKLFTAKTIVSILHGQQQAEQALQHFQDTFSNKVFPKNAPEIITEKQTLSVFDILKLGLPSQSNSEIRRLIAQGGVIINDIRQNDEKVVFETKLGLKVKVGKRTFFKVLCK